MPSGSTSVSLGGPHLGAVRLDFGDLGGPQLAAVRLDFSDLGGPQLAAVRLDFGDLAELQLGAVRLDFGDLGDLDLCAVVGLDVGDVELGDLGGGAGAGGREDLGRGVGVSVGCVDGVPEGVRGEGHDQPNIQRTNFDDA